MSEIVERVPSLTDHLRMHMARECQEAASLIEKLEAELLKATEALTDARETIVELWHDANSGHGALHECLGMTWDEYAAWVNPTAATSVGEKE